MEDRELVDNILSVFGNEIEIRFLVTVIGRCSGLNALRKRLRRN